VQATRPDRVTAPKGYLGTLIGYALMIGGAVLVFLLIRAQGETLSAPPGSGTPFGQGGGHSSAEVLLHVLLALVAIIIMARLLGGLFARLHQPPVIGEIIAGILLGPSLLGQIAPGASAFLLPPSVAPVLGVLSQVGVILYMFLVGLELDPRLLRSRGHSTVAISHASIVTPFLLGAGLALWLYPRFSSSDVPFLAFSLFLGVSMSVTAFPVLARILTDRRVHQTRMGVIALTCAAVDDVTAWCMLAFVVSVVNTHASGALLTAVLALGFIVAMVVAVRPAMVWLVRLYGNAGRLTQGILALVFVAVLLASVTTELIGIHAVFGAFALGAVIPHDSDLARDLTDRLEDIVIVLLLPAFFAFTGLRTQIGLVNGVEQWLACGLIIVVATIGKWGGSAVAARLTGLPWRDSHALGVLMNTRGLMELIVLNIGLELGVLSPTLFAMLVLMAVVTTLATTPVLHFITRGQKIATGETAAEPESVAPGGILVPIANPAAIPSLMNIAIAVTSPKAPPPRALLLVRRPTGDLVRSGLRELEQRDTPRTPLLARALDYAYAQGRVVEVRAMWTDDPARDIIEVAQKSGSDWVLIGFSRPVFGSDPLGGMVKAIMEGAAGKPISVGIAIHGHERKLDVVRAMVDDSRDGRAALDLAIRFAWREGCRVGIVVVPGTGTSPEPRLAALLADAERRLGRAPEVEILAPQARIGDAFQAAGDLVIIGSSMADEYGLPLDSPPGGEAHCVVVVQGGSDVAAPAGATAEPAGS
jgi:Kef-type K+ transport system membrane component KefB